MTRTDIVEDAISLDDDALIEACLGLDGKKSVEGPGRSLPDWPNRADQGVLIAIDPDLVEWFQARSPNWRNNIERVLRAWIKANSTLETPAQASGPQSN